MDGVIRLLRDGEFGYIRGQEICKSSDCEFYVNRTTVCYQNQTDTHNIMVKRCGEYLHAATSDIDDAACAEVTPEQLLTRDYIPVIKDDGYLSKGFEPYITRG
ncbi:MAG: hypothetical protein UU59_C0006G0013 [candidate division WWE3 bacterium GW2011_GWE1_41_27]|nr:MAG: hypothetical protein UU59_C0006G0013 [candidate division WWE3 bacterium GW2011_GWE1_41_27]KKS60874.1 MAG: hypothetical protein UV26_C0001G0026 [candidate division WWE3 bacterium GW2011_GWF2_42_42]